jgi:hypothetical protein
VTVAATVRVGLTDASIVKLTRGLRDNDGNTVEVAEAHAEPEKDMAVDGEFDTRDDREELAEPESDFVKREDADALIESEACELGRGDKEVIDDSVGAVLQLAIRLLSDDGLPPLETVCPVDDAVADTIAAAVNEATLLTTGETVSVCVDNLDAAAETDACAVRELKSDPRGDNDASAVNEFDCEIIAEIVPPLAVGAREVSPLLDATLEAIGDSDGSELADPCTVRVAYID